MNPETFMWPSTQQILPLAKGDVHVFAWDLDPAPSAQDWKVLDETETLRARRFVFPRDRDRYVRAHAIMRALLAGYLKSPPAEISFANGEFGKPHIQSSRIESAEETQPIQFNLTHSGGIALLAVAWEYELGVDVEAVRPIGKEVAEHHFSHDELRALGALPPEQWLAGFYRCWTSKEALLKGVGCGLNLALDAFDVEADPLRAPALLAWRPPAKAVARWRLIDLRAAADTAGTLAVRDPASGFSPENVHCFRFHP